jgi:hypothetical protein
MYRCFPPENPKLYLEILAILKKRGKPPRWSTRSAAELFMQSSDYDKTNDPMVNPDTNKGQYYCHMCAAGENIPHTIVISFEIKSSGLFGRKLGWRRTLRCTMRTMHLSLL